MKNIIATFFGGLAGAFLFLIFSVYFFGHPFSDWFMSVHGMIFPPKKVELTTKQVLDLYNLMQKGAVITPDGLISTISTLYGNVIQVLIGVLAGATLLAFFAVRWQSVQAAQDYVDKKVDEQFKSIDFANKLNAQVQNYIDMLDPSTNPQVRKFDADVQLAYLKERIDKIEQQISSSASPEEPDDDIQE